MIPFLKNIADTYYRTYGQTISELTFVFPNRRAGIFFQKYLAEAFNHPVFSPRILTIDDLFSILSRYKTADKIEMLFLLYDLYKDISGSPESFDDFVFWGEMILNDFDDVDKYMVDARQLFRNVYDLKEIDAGLTYLTEEQVSAIRRFWSNFISLDENNRKKEFIEMWEVLYELYASLKDELKKRGLAYQGMIFREIAENISEKEASDFPFSRIVFVGLNAISKSEEVLLKHLNRLNIADFYWDYSSELVKDPYNKASAFIDKNKMFFPSQLPLLPEEPDIEKPVIETIGIPSIVGQAKYTNAILKDLITEKKIDPSDALNTAVILPDENQLLPLLYSIPEEISNINVTMGYNLSNSSISGLMDHIFNVQRNIRYIKKNPGYYFRFVLPVINHKYIVNIIGEEARTIKENIIKYNKIIVPYEELKSNPILEYIFCPTEQWQDIPEYLKTILAHLQFSLQQKKDSQTTDVRSTDIEREFIIEYYKTINKMADALKNTGADMSVDTYFRLLKKLIAGISVPFAGEPLTGLQIMGMLETRTLDFENLIILSMNEGIFPKQRTASSFIPHNLRKGFGLPTYEHQDSIYSYHFYRLINRAKRIYLVYDTRTEGLQTGEVSRYFKQLKYLYPERFEIREKLAVYEVLPSKTQTINIQKDASVMAKLDDFLTGSRNLSASAINIYLDCPLQFYFSVVMEMKEDDEIEETIEASAFGSIFHSAMEWIYRPLEGKLITADLLHNIRKNEKLLTEIIERSFAKNYFRTDENNLQKLTGQNFLTGEIIKSYIKQVLSVDAKLTPFTYMQSEKKILISYTFENNRNVWLKGFIDRIDSINDHTRIIDYKTGKIISQYKSLAQLFDKEIKDRPKAIMQVFMYALLYSEENPGRKITPAIYSLRNLFNENFEAGIINKPSPGESIKILNFSPVKQEFKEHFDKCLSEIFDRKIPFSQTPNGKACEWCSFSAICRK